ncbi:MAG TPA: carboxypeptidase regulatory-like domain-containing protein [Longimicrobiales bacterium]|nr:carboxypeptidase regulatory-like domain-containing protein [Longimicrobiales bacterium]
MLSLASAEGAGAQHIRGRLLDVETDAPIPGGILTLLSADSTRVSTAVSDQEGFWVLDVPAAGTYHVSAQRFGYQSWISGQVEVGAGAELNSVFHLRPAPVTLDPIEVRVRAVRQYLDYAGFFERQRGNFGHFVTPEAIERRQAANVTDLLAGIPGVQRVAFGGGSAGPAQIQLRGSSLSQGGLCRPRVFVDGLMFSRGDSRPIREREGAETEERVDDPLRQDQALSIDDIGHPSTIAAIEVYRSASQVPVQFGGTSVETLCGVIVIWTHTGRVRAAGR